MLRAIGYKCDLHVEKGWARPRGPMLYDPSGKAWPRCSLLFLPFQSGPVEKSPPSDVVDFYGDNYTVHRGHVSLPSRELSSWTRVGQAKEIEYTRPGTRAPGDYGHLFGKRRWQTLFRKYGLPVLYVSGSAYRLQLGSGCVIDWRGIVGP